MPIYMQISGVVGEVSDGPFAGAFEILSWSEGVTSTGLSSTGAGAGKPTFSDVTVVAPYSAHLPSLFLACANGSHLQNVVFSFVQNRNNGREFTYLTITLTNAIITSCTVSSGGDRPQESLSFEYEKIQLKTVERSGALIDEAIFNVSERSAG